MRLAPVLLLAAVATYATLPEWYGYSIEATGIDKWDTDSFTEHYHTREDAEAAFIKIAYGYMRRYTSCNVRLLDVTGTVSRHVIAGWWHQESIREMIATQQVWVGWDSQYISYNECDMTDSRYYDADRCNIECERLAWQ